MCVYIYIYIYIVQRDVGVLGVVAHEAHGLARDDLLAAYCIPIPIPVHIMYIDVTYTTNIIYG